MQKKIVIAKEDTTPPAYATRPGNYNRISGNKTLMFVSVIIVLIVILCVIALVLMNQQPAVIIK